MRSTRTMSRQGGFTLIEIVIAVAVMALLTAAAVLSFNRPLNRARTAEAIEQLKYLDASSRDFARRSGRRIEIAFDLSENHIERREGANRDATFNTTIASPIKIEAIWTLKERTEDGEATIPISSLGVSQTYAVKLAGPEGERWLLFTGLAGESATYNNDEQVQAIFSKIAARRDTD